MGPMPTGWYSAARRLRASRSSMAVTLHSSALLPGKATLRDYRRTRDAPRWPAEFDGVLDSSSVDRGIGGRLADRHGLVPGEPHVTVVRWPGSGRRRGEHLGHPDVDRRARRLQRSQQVDDCLREPVAVASFTVTVTVTVGIGARCIGITISGIVAGGIGGDGIRCECDGA